MIDPVVGGLLLGSILSLMCYTVLLGDQPIAKLAENIYMGAYTGYLFAFNLVFIYNSGYLPLAAGKIYYIIVLLLCIMLYFRFVKQYAWVYRFPTAVAISASLALAMRSMITSQFLDQIRGTILPLTTPSLLTNFNNLIMIVGTVTATVYFYFSREFTGTVAKGIWRTGRYFLLIAFGATYGQTVIFRLELVVGRFLEVLDRRVIMYSTLFAIIIFAVLAVLYKTGKSVWYKM